MVVPTVPPFIGDPPEKRGRRLISFLFWKGFGKASSVRPQRLVKQCWMSSSEQHEILLSFTFLDSCVCFSAPP